ncbi:MAG: alpha/beta hydrolase [Rubrivivax sp.]|nr:alpha/beta hydrolase [Rubrivivax sp.]
MTAPQLRDGAWLDAQYNARAGIPDHPAILRQWAERSEAALAAGTQVLDVAYGSDASEHLDLFLPPRSGTTQRAAPVLVYIHGGYWRALDKRDQRFVAPPFTEAGALVVLPNYALCPAVRIEHIVLQMVQALAWVWRNAGHYGGDPSRIVVAGHSAGGHLATMLLQCRWHQVASDLPPSLLRAALSVSGLYDLEPLRHAPFLAGDLRLDDSSARRLSPARMPPPAGRLVALVGGDESAEFHRQQALIARAWRGRVLAEVVPGCHHMNVLHTLADPGSRTFEHAVNLLGLA